MSKTPPDYVVDVLGGPQVFRGRTAPTAAQVRDTIKRGLPYRSLETMRERLHLSLPEAAVVLNVPLRTLSRRRLQRRLASDESDRLYRLARIAAIATSALGSEATAVEWLRRPNRSLAGHAPIEILDTEVGARQVEDVLGRLEHGVIG